MPLFTKGCTSSSDLYKFLSVKKKKILIHIFEEYINVMAFLYYISNNYIASELLSQTVS